ncbi:DUF4357 domain-containing protein [Lysobacter sp. CW239]|nr:MULTISPECIES: DUF4357 domain-containing protein [Lysobacter]QOD90378.1 DUF4357 domain-containing protein [Lysobacter sp. CW239]
MSTYLLQSPSGAAACLTDRTASGWIEWKDAQGQSLSDRKALAAEVAD